MPKGKPKRREPASLAALAAEAGLEPDQLKEIEQKSGKEAAKTICRCIIRVKGTGAPDPYDFVVGVYEKYGHRALPKIFPRVQDPHTYVEGTSARMKDYVYESVLDMGGWAWVAGKLYSTDSDGQAVNRQVELGALIALDGESERGMLISENARASYSIVNPRTWKPCAEDTEHPPPFGWRIGMFEGDPENKTAVTPLMIVAADLDQKVRDIKDLVDFTLTCCAIVEPGTEGPRGWHRLGEFPDIGPPDLSDVTEPEVRRRLTIGLSAEGFYGANSPNAPQKEPPMSLINRLLGM